VISDERLRRVMMGLHPNEEAVNGHP